MKAGKLRHSVTIQSLVTGSPDQLPSGEPNVAWTNYLTGVSADIQPLRGRELFAAQEHHSEATVRFVVRWRAGITDTMRVVHAGLYYGIVWVPPVDRAGKQRDLELLTKQGVANG